MRCVAVSLALCWLASVGGCAVSESSSVVPLDPVARQWPRGEVPRGQAHRGQAHRQRAVASRPTPAKDDGADISAPDEPAPPRYRVASALRRRTPRNARVGAAPKSMDQRPSAIANVASRGSVAPLPVAPLPVEPLPPESLGSSSPEPDGLQRDQDVSADSSIAGDFLTLSEAQCAAANHAPLARAMDHRRREVEQIGAERKHLRASAALVSALLACEALKDRNKAAADAVAAYYGLAEMQRQRHILRALRTRWQSTTTALDRIREQGLDAGDPTATQRQQYDIRQQEIELEHTVERLAQSLHVRMGRARLSPIPTLDVELAVNRNLVDVEAAVADGLACRPDLGQLRILIHCTNTDNSETAQQLMELLQPSLGDLLAAKCECFSCLKCLLPDCDACCDVNRLRAHLQRLYRAAHEAAELEISDQAIKVNLAVRTLENSEQTWSLWRRRVAQLEKLVEQESSYFKELSEARFEQLRAEGKVVHHKAQLDAARGKLLFTQGMLARQCGCRGCCDSGCIVPPIQASSLISNQPAAPVEVIDASDRSTSDVRDRVAWSLPEGDLPAAEPSDSKAQPLDLYFESPTRIAPAVFQDDLSDEPSR